MDSCSPEPSLKDLLDSLSEIEEDEDLSLRVETFNFPGSETFWVCNGYYGPNFDEPLCGMCHCFLYPTNPTEELVMTLSDDEDSGNDEPPFNTADKEKQEADDEGEDIDPDELPSGPEEEVIGPIENEQEKPGTVLLPIQRPTTE